MSKLRLTVFIGSIFLAFSCALLNDEFGTGEGGLCGYNGIAAPVDVSPDDTVSSLGCIKVGLAEVGALVNRSAEEMGDGDLVLTSDCIGIETPSNVKFVTKTAMPAQNGKTRTLGFHCPIKSIRSSIKFLFQKTQHCWLPR